MGKKLRFHVSLKVCQLISVPYVSGIVFAKVKSPDKTAHLTKRNRIESNSVVWEEEFGFDCKMTMSSSTGVLNPSICRISIRKETNGGKSYDRLGIVEVNLAEFAGAGLQEHRYLLQEAEKSQRSANCILKIMANLTLTAGDPVFKAPSMRDSRGMDQSLMLQDVGHLNAAALPRSGPDQLKRRESTHSEMRRPLSSSRVDADEIVSSLLDDMSLENKKSDSLERKSSLRLHVSRDGKASVGGSKLPS